MNVKITTVDTNSTPAAEMREKIVENAVSLMVVGGALSSITSIKYSSGFCEKQLVSVTQFKDAPFPVKNQGVVIKDAIAQILGVANVTRVTVELDDKERENVTSAWNAAVKAAEEKAAQADKSDLPKPQGNQADASAKAEQPEPEEPDDGADFHMNIMTEKA